MWPTCTPFQSEPDAAPAHCPAGGLPVPNWPSSPPTANGFITDRDWSWRPNRRHAEVENAIRDLKYGVQCRRAVSPPTPLGWLQVWRITWPVGKGGDHQDPAAVLLRRTNHPTQRNPIRIHSLVYPPHNRRSPQTDPGREFPPVLNGHRDLKTVRRPPIYPNEAISPAVPSPPLATRANDNLLITLKNCVR